MSSTNANDKLYDQRRRSAAAKKRREAFGVGRALEAFSDVDIQDTVAYLRHTVEKVLQNPNIAQAGAGEITRAMDPPAIHKDLPLGPALAAHGTIGPTGSDDAVGGRPPFLDPGRWPAPSDLLAFWFTPEENALGISLAYQDGDAPGQPLVSEYRLIRFTDAADVRQQLTALDAVKLGRRALCLSSPAVTALVGGLTRTANAGNQFSSSVLAPRVISHPDCFDEKGGILSHRRPVNLNDAIVSLRSRLALKDDPAAPPGDAGVEEQLEHWAASPALRGWTPGSSDEVELERIEHKHEWQARLLWRIYARVWELASTPLK